MGIIQFMDYSKAGIELRSSHAEVDEFVQMDYVVPGSVGEPILKGICN